MKGFVDKYKLQIVIFGCICTGFSLLAVMYDYPVGFITGLVGSGIGLIGANRYPKRKRRRR